MDANSASEDGCETGDIPTTGLSLWFMADRGLALEADRATRWLDQSPNEAVASQVIAAQMPLLVSFASGPPMLEFDGVDDHFALAPGFASFDGSGFLAVVEAFEKQDCAGILHFSNGDDGDDVEFGRHTPNLLYYEVVGEFVEGTKDAFVAGPRLLISIVQGLDGLTELRLNTVLDASQTLNLPRVVQRAQNYIGKNAYDECPSSFHGRIGEIVHYSRWIDAAERQRIERYLLAKWAIAIQ